MRRKKKVIKRGFTQSRIFKLISAIALLCLLYLGIKCYAYTEELKPQDVIQQAQVEESSAIAEETAEIQDVADVIESSEQESCIKEEGKDGPDAVSEVEQEKLTSEPKALGNLVPEGVVYDPNGESFVTINGEVVREGDSIGGFELTSINPDMVLFDNGEQEYEVPFRAIDSFGSIISSFKDIYVEGLLYDAHGESFVVINNIVAGEGDTVGGFHIEAIEDSKVLLKQADLRFEVFLPHSAEEEIAKQAETTALVEAEDSTMALDVPTAVIE